MDRRKEQRINLPGDATLRLLDSGNVAANEPGSYRVRILDISGSGMRIRLARPLPCGSLVEIDAGDTISLGEVCRCIQEDREEGAASNDAESSKGASYSLGIQIKHTLASVSELERFSRLLDEYSAPRCRKEAYAKLPQA